MPERYQKEIEEILRQAGDLSSDARPRRSQDGLFRLIRLQLSQSFGGKRWSLTPGRVMLVGVVLTLAGLVLGSAILFGIRRVTPGEVDTLGHRI